MANKRKTIDNNKKMFLDDLIRLFEATDFYTEVDRNRVYRTVDDAVHGAHASRPPRSKEPLTAVASILTTDTQLEDSP